MGAVPKGLNYTLSSLKLCPENASWIHQRNVCLRRSETGSVGIKIETLYTTNCSTYTVVTKIKPECDYQYGHLILLDRILKINDTDICHLKYDDVANIIRHLCGKSVKLSVVSVDCSNGNHKRAFDRLSTSSDRSLDMRKVVEKSRNKRMAKSNSVESEDEPLLNASSGQLSPDTPPVVESGSGCMRDGSNQMFHSLPDNFTAAIQFPRQNEERHMSLPLEAVNSEKKYVIDSSAQHKDTEIYRQDPKRPNSVIAVNSVVLSPDQKLTYPQMLKWELPKAVDISRGSKGCFGFTYKVKTCKLQTEEIYTMVNHIAKDGPACGKLMVADWIRSVNGQPLQNAEQAKKIPDMLAQETTIHIVIQRPEGLLVSPKAMSTPRDRLTIPRIDRPITSPAQRATDIKQKRGCAEIKHSGITRKVNVVPEKNPSEPVQGYQKDCQLFDVFRVGVDLNDSGSFVETLQDSCSITGVDMILPDDIMSMRNMQMNRTINLSKVRIFLCGSDARTFAKLLFPTYAPQFTGDMNSGKMYHCVKCMMGMDKSGAISFRPWSSLDRLLNDGEVTNLHASSDSLATGDVSKDRGGDDDSFIHQGSVNVEFFIVPDEKFFHHCCQYLFTRTSIFVLTFDGAKVLKSANAEILHLENIIHTIRCFDGYECPILTYGLLSNSDLSVSAIDEVRTLFYLPYGQQIQKYNVPMPDLFCPFLTNMESHDVTRQIQRKMWKVIVDIVQKQHVIIPTVSIISHLDEARQDGKQSITDNCFTEMFKKCVPGDYPDIQQIVWTDLKNFGETLSSKAAPMTMSHLQYLDKLLFIDTEILLTSIQNIILHSCKIMLSSEGIKQKWLKVLSTGIIAQEDLVNMISYQGGNVDNIVHLLEIFGLIYRQNVSAEAGIHYFIPYFIKEQSPTDMMHLSELCVYLLFRAHVHVSSMLFYQLAFGLNADSDTKNINVQGSSHCTVHHMGYEISLYHHKLLDRVQITITRTEKILCKPCSIFQWLSKQCRALLGNEIKYVLGPACPLQQCSFIKHFPTEVHVLDMSRSQVFCGDTRVDNHRSVKVWIQDASISKPVQSVKRVISDSGSCESNRSEKLQWYVNDLPYSVLHRISVLLMIDSKNNDWKTLGGLLGLSTEDVNSYATQKEAPMQLLIDFGRKHVLTVSRLLELLSDQDLERLDVKQVLQDWLNG